MHDFLKMRRNQGDFLLTFLLVEAVLAQAIYSLQTSLPDETQTVFQKKKTACLISDWISLSKNIFEAMRRFGGG